MKIENTPYFKIDQVALGLSVMNKQSKDLAIRVHVFNYQYRTNYPIYLDRNYYYIYSHTLSFDRDGTIKTTRDGVHGESRIIMGWADTRIWPETEEELISMIKDKFKLPK